MAASVVSDFASQSNVTNLFNKNIGTVSYFTDNVKKYDLTLDVNQNGYIFGKKVDVNINKLEYKYTLTGNGTDTIKGINILSPSYSLSCDKDWVNIKYINPYGIWDSLTLFGNITEQVNVNRTDAYRVSENLGLNRAKLNVGRQKFIGNNEINREYVFESDYVDYNTYRAFGEIIESKFTKIITNNTPISYTFSGTFSSVNLDYKYGNIPTDGFGQYYINSGYNIKIGGAFGTISYTQPTDETGGGSFPIDPFYAILPSLKSTFAPTYSVDLVAGIGTYPFDFALQIKSNKNESFYDILTYSNSPISATGVNGVFNKYELNSRLPGVADFNIYEDIIINNTSFDYRNEREYKPLKLDFSYSSVKKSRN